MKKFYWLALVLFSLCVLIVTTNANEISLADNEIPFETLYCNTSQGAQTTFTIDVSTKENSRWTSLFVSSAAGEEPIVDVKTGVCEAGSECQVAHYAPFPGLGRTWTTQITLTPNGSFSRQSIGCISS